MRAESKKPADDASPVRVSVIVPVWNGAAVIDKCLQAIRDQSCPPEQVEIIVVDNGSSDDTVSRLGATVGVRVIEEPTPGSYAARNAGLRAATGEWVAFTDADCAVSRDWLRHALDAAAQPAAAPLNVYTGPIELERAPDGEQGAYLYEKTFSFDQKKYAALGRCVTANWFCRRTLFDHVGLFDERLKSGGDVEMASRVCAVGGRIVFVDGMRVHHPARASTGELTGKKRRTIGGSWSRSNSPLKGVSLFASLSRDAIRRSVRVLLGDTPARSKWTLLSIVLKVYAAGVSELFALSLGGTARRA